jgi:hypothetical protein
MLEFPALSSRSVGSATSILAYTDTASGQVQLNRNECTYCEGPVTKLDFPCQKMGHQHPHLLSACRLHSIHQAFEVGDGNTEILA